MRDKPPTGPSYFINPETGRPLVEPKPERKPRGLREWHFESGDED